MNKIRILFLLTAFLPVLGAGPAAGSDTQPPETHFSLVKGKVEVVSGGGIARAAAAGDKAYPGETIQVGAKAQARVVLFDGSTLDLSANSKLTLATIQQPSTSEKIISLKLALGRVFAQVRKLMTAKSSFEIEAGGVVCGVRGTAFSMDYNPETKSLDLDVSEGKVSATSGGNTLFFTAGQSGHFLNGQLTGKGGSNNTGTKSGGKGSSGGGTSAGDNSSSGNSGGNGNSNGNAGGSSGGSNSNGGGTEGGANPGSTGDNTGTGASGGGEVGGNNSNPIGNNPAGSGTGASGEANPGSSGGFQANACLSDLNTQFTSGILINGENNLNESQQSIQIHIIVPPGEAVP